MWHYTTEAGMAGIVSSGVIYPSLKATSPTDVRHGEGVYLTDITARTLSAQQLSRRLLGVPWLGHRFTHFVEINVEGLPAVSGSRGIFVVPTTAPLPVADRLVSFGSNE